LSVSIKGEDGLTHSASTPISSINSEPASTSVTFDASRLTGSSANILNDIYSPGTDTGITVSGNNLSMPLNEFNTKVLNNYLTKYSPDNSSSTNIADIYFEGIDQYGTDDAPITTLTATSTNAGTSYNTDNGKLNLASGTAQDGDVITLTGVTSTGLVQSVNITISENGAIGTGTGSGTTSTSAATALSNINAGTEALNSTTNDFTTAGVTGAIVANKTAYDLAIKTAISTVGGILTESQVQTQVTNVNATATFAATVSAATTEVATAGTAQSAYTNAKGSVTNADYIAVSTASVTLAADLSATPQVASTLTSDTTALTTAVAKLTTDTTTLTAANTALQNSITAANAEINLAVTAKTSYLAVTGSPTDVVYTAVSTASATLAADLSATPQVTATINNDTTALTTATNALNVATAGK
jgi:hypothetical protein